MEPINPSAALLIAYGWTGLRTWIQLYYLSQVLAGTVNTVYQQALAIVIKVYFLSREGRRLA